MEANQALTFYSVAIKVLFNRNLANIMKMTRASKALIQLAIRWQPRSPNARPLVERVPTLEHQLAWFRGNCLVRSPNAGVLPLRQLNLGAISGSTHDKRPLTRAGSHRMARIVSDNFSTRLIQPPV